MEKYKEAKKLLFEIINKIDKYQQIWLKKKIENMYQYHECHRKCHWDIL